MPPGSLRVMPFCSQSIQLKIRFQQFSGFFRSRQRVSREIRVTGTHVGSALRAPMTRMRYGAGMIARGYRKCLMRKRFTGSRVDLDQAKEDSFSTSLLDSVEWGYLSSRPAGTKKYQAKSSRMTERAFPLLVRLALWRESCARSLFKDFSGPNRLQAWHSLRRFRSFQVQGGEHAR